MLLGFSERKLNPLQPIRKRCILAKTPGRTQENNVPQTIHTPLHLLSKPGEVSTGGRLHQSSGRWWLENAHARVELYWASGLLPELHEDALSRVAGVWDGARIEVTHLDIAGRPQGGEGTRLDLGEDGQRSEMMRANARMRARIRDFFARQDFLEATTPCMVPEPGTDVYLEPFKTVFVPEDAVVESYSGETASARATLKNVFPAFLQTSPEFAMKRLLVEGFERIWQLTHGWRNGEVTDRHIPEFTILEWYRAWQDVESIIDDVESLTRMVLDGVARLGAPGAPVERAREIDLRGAFERVTMQELFEEACGFDLLEALDYADLLEQIRTHGLLGRRVGEELEERKITQRMFDVRTTQPLQPLRAAEQHDERWAQLFFELQVTHLDPLLERMGAVFVTEWPAPLAVLARKSARDPRVAERFELYIGGLELANGFGELCDAQEQRRRFEEDLRQRHALGRPGYPMPTRLLAALERGMPPSAGVAMGVDRLLMLATGAGTITEVTPFSLRRDHETGEIGWGY